MLFAQKAAATDPYYMIIAPIVLLMLLAARLAKSGVSVGGPAIVLSEFDTDPDDGDDAILNLTGRPAGLVGFILSAIGFDITTRLSVTRDKVSLSQSSLSGQFRQLFPNHQIASAHCGYSANIASLILAGLLLIGGLAAFIATQEVVALLVMLLIAGLCVLSFFLSKYLMIAFETTGGLIMGVRFKKGLIENVPIGLEELQHVIELFNETLRQSKAGGDTAPARRREEKPRREERREEPRREERPASRGGTEWYYRRGGKKFGPITPRDLKRMIDDGEIGPNDMLWKDGMEEWVALRDFDMK